MRTRSNHHGGSTSESNPYLQAGLATGYLCRRAEEELERIGAASGTAVSARELGEWMGRFLLSKSQAHPNGLDDSQRVPEMRTRPAQGYALGTGEAETHVRPRRDLSLKARASISRAQRKRWKLQKRAERARVKGYAASSRKPADWKLMSKADKQRWYRSQQQAKSSVSAKRANYSKAQSSYWASMSDAERAAEMKRRTLVRQGKAPSRRSKTSHSKGKANGKASGNMEPGFWLKQVTSMIRSKPRPQREIYKALYERFPWKKDSISVALATMKHKKQVVEVDGVLTLPNGAVAEATA